MTRVLALCADDYGQSPGINAGIVRLAQAGRLTAVSCITNAPHWADEGERLQGLPEPVDVGLHINFTEGRPLSARLARRWPTMPSLPVLIARAHLGLLPQAEMRNEVHAQLRAFIHAYGAPPRYVDGHQHVHHLPGLREAILDMVEHLQPLPAVRSTARVLGPGFAWKRFLIERTGGRRLGVSLGERMIGHNPALLGVYDFAAPDYGALMRQWLDALPAEGGLLFCHPGEPDVAADPIKTARDREFAYLNSAAFTDDLRAADVVLGRVWQAPRVRSIRG